MGSCFSKEPQITGQRLGEKQPSQQQSRQTQTASVNVPKSESKPPQGHKLGASSGSDESPSTRSAAAKAAEERFNKQQEQLKQSQAKLKAMSKVSRQEKGL